MDDLVISVKNISKSFKLPHEKKMRLKDYFLHPFSKTKYETFHALQKIDFDVKKGEFVGVIGRNGSGKSTLLKILAGVYLPDTGSVEINGNLVPFLELGVGFNPELTGRENVFMNGTILGLTKKQILKKYDEIVAFAELENFMDTQLKHYSSGMQVRLAFAIAIQAKGDVYLLDEVLAVGDAGFQTKSQQEILRLKREGKTIIFISHDYGSVQKFSDKVIWLDDSEIRGMASTQNEILKLVSEYLKIFSEKAKEEQSEKDILLVEPYILNSQNQQSKIFATGDKMIIRLDYKFKKPERLKDLSIGIGILNGQGITVYGTNTELKKQPIATAEGSVFFELEKLNLLAGSYALILGADLNPEGRCLFDMRQFPFTVLSDDNSSGIVPLNAKVSIQNHEE